MPWHLLAQPAWAGSLVTAGGSPSTSRSALVQRSERVEAKSSQKVLIDQGARLVSGYHAGVLGVKNSSAIPSGSLKLNTVP